MMPYIEHEYLYIISSLNEDNSEIIMNTDRSFSWHRSFERMISKRRSIRMFSKKEYCFFYKFLIISREFSKYSLECRSCFDKHTYFIRVLKYTSNSSFVENGHAACSSPLSTRAIISSRYLLYATSLGSYICVGVPECFTWVSVIVMKVERSVPANSAYSRAQDLSSGSSRIVVATFRGLLVVVIFFIFWDYIVRLL